MKFLTISLILLLISSLVSAQLSLSGKKFELGSHPTNDQLFILKILDANTNELQDLWEMSATVTSIEPENFESLLQNNTVFPHGKHYSLYPDMNVKYQETFEYGKRFGEIKAFYPTGELKFQAAAYRGKLVGEASQYYKNGVQKKSEFHHQLSPEKVVKEYYPSGNIKSELEFNSFKPHGSAKFYFDNGSIKRKIKFNEGIITSEKCFDSSGIKTICSPLVEELKFPGGQEAFKKEIEKIEFEQSDITDTSVCKITLHINPQGEVKLLSSLINKVDSFENQIGNWVKQLPNFTPLIYNEEAVHTTLEIRFPFVNKHAVWLGQENQRSSHNFKFNNEALEDCASTFWFYSIPASNEVYMMVDQMPEFPGGEEGLRHYIARNVNYPLEAQQAGIQGKVYVSFIVDQKGDIIAPKVVRSVHHTLDREALRVVRFMPKWKPGVHNGEKVCVSYTCPINFKFR